MANPEVSVFETGSNIGKETMAKIFEPFFTIEESGKGTGLGLATGYRIIRQHNGCIAAYREPGKGMTFT